MSIPIKQYYYLMSDEHDKVYNILPYNYSICRAKSVQPSYKNYMINIILTIIKEYEKRPIFDFIENRLNRDDYLIVLMDEQILPAFFTSDGYLCINISILGTNLLTMDSKSLFTLFLHGFILRECMILAKTDKFKAIEYDISDFFYAVLIKLFRKKQGLAVSDKLMKDLRFLCALYTLVSLFGYDMNNQTINKISSALYYKPTDLKLNYDFSNPIEFFDCIRYNNIMSISSNIFVYEVVRRFDEYSVAIFEDVCRFVSMCTTLYLTGSSLFSGFWTQIRKDIIDKVSNFYLETTLR